MPVRNGIIGELIVEIKSRIGHKDAIAGNVDGAKSIATAVEEKFRNNMAGSKWKKELK